MLKLSSVKQTPGYCGPASLQMILAYYGITKSEQALARLAGATRAHGVGGEGLLRAARAVGFQGKIKDNATIADIRRSVITQKIPVIVNWFSEDEGHYSVVVHVDHHKIYLQDPEMGRLRSLDLETFNRVWFGFAGDYLTSPKDLRLRRLIIIQPPGALKARRGGNKK